MWFMNAGVPWYDAANACVDSECTRRDASGVPTWDVACRDRCWTTAQKEYEIKRMLILGGVGAGVVLVAFLLFR